MTVSIAVVIPTRNRQDYAIRAVRSLLDQSPPIDIYVCDNSTSPDVLRAFCRDLPQVTYLRPDRELPMGENWDWGVRQAMERSTASHFNIHYDRKVSKPKIWTAIADKAARYPNDLISFPADHVGTQPPPLRLWLTPWTDKLFSIDCLHVASLLAKGCVAEIAHALPILSNCLVPRDVLERIRDRFGDICVATGPDAAFMMRFMALNARYLHYDRGQGVIYGSTRSNGLGYMRNKGGDFADFQKLSGDKPWLDAAPLPGVNLGSNMLYHEYEIVRRETGDRFRPLEREGVLHELASELRWIADPRQRAVLRETLVEHGWTATDPQPFATIDWNATVYQWKCRLRMALGGAVPPSISGFSFLNDAEAVRFAMKYPSRPLDNHEHLARLEPIEA